MTHRPPLSNILRTPECWLFTVALLVQLFVLVGFSDSRYFLPNADDPKFYNDWALRILAGQWTDGRAFYGLPGYAYLLAAIYSVTGFDPFVVGLLQAVAMATISVLLLRLSRLAFSSDKVEALDVLAQRRPVIIGVAAGIGWAFFRPAHAFSIILMPTIWLVLAYWGCVLWAARTRTASIWRPWLAMGLCVGVVAMLVATIFFVLPLMLAAIAMSVAPGEPVGRRLLRVLAAVVILLAGVFVGTSPAWFHNYIIAKDPVFLSGHSGLNFFMGNHAEANGYPKPPAGLRSSQAELLQDSILIPEAEAGRTLKRAEVSRYWSEKAKAWTRENPVEWFKLMAQKIRNFWNAFQYDDIGAVPLFRAIGILPPGLTFGIVAALGLPAVIWGMWRFPRSRWIAAAVLLHMAAVLSVFVTERYRLAAAPGLLLLGSFWLWQGAAWVKNQKWRSVAAWALGTAVAAWFVTIPQTDPGALSLADYKVGVRALEAGDLDLAEKSLLRAQELVPNNAEAHFALGNLWLAKGEPQKAKAAYISTLQLKPRHSSALSNLGVIAMRQDFPGEAEKLFLASIQAEPDDAKTYYLLALARLETGRREEAGRALDVALQLRPGQREFLELRHKLQSSIEATSKKTPAP